MTIMPVAEHSYGWRFTWRNSSKAFLREWLLSGNLNEEPASQKEWELQKEAWEQKVGCAKGHREASVNGRCEPRAEVED